MKITKYISYISLKNDFVLANSTDPDDMRRFIWSLSTCLGISSKHRVIRCICCLMFAKKNGTSILIKQKHKTKTSVCDLEMP